MTGWFFENFEKSILGFLGEFFGLFDYDEFEFVLNRFLKDMFFELADFVNANGFFEGRYYRYIRGDFSKIDSCTFGKLSCCFSVFVSPTDDEIALECRHN